MHGCCGAAGQSSRRATPQELAYLKACGALPSSAVAGGLISVGTAFTACGKAGVAAPLLAATAGTAELQPDTASLAQAQLLSAPPPGVMHECHLLCAMHMCKPQLAECEACNAGSLPLALPPLPATLPPHSTPAGSLSKPHSWSPLLLAPLPTATQLLQLLQLVKAAAQPAVTSHTAEPGAGQARV